MKHLFKSFSKQDYVFIILVIGLIVAQVWLDLTMPDYTAKLTTSVSSGSVTMADIWKNGGLMLLCAFGSLCCSLICGFIVAKIASSFSKNVRYYLFDKITSFSSAEMNQLRCFLNNSGINPCSRN